VGTTLGAIDERLVGKADTTSVGLCVGTVDEISLGIPDDRLGVKLGAPDGPLAGKADGIAVGTTRWELGGIDDFVNDDTCVGSLLGLVDGVPGGNMLSTKLGGADGIVVGTVESVNSINIAGANDIAGDGDTDGASAGWLDGSLLGVPENALGAVD
jgi:hypothetical protein